MISIAICPTYASCSDDNHVNLAPRVDTNLALIADADLPPVVHTGLAHTDPVSLHAIMLSSFTH